MRRFRIGRKPRVRAGAAPATLRSGGLLSDPATSAEPLAFVRNGLSARRARELELVLHSQAMPCRIVGAEGRFALQVREAELAAAARVLALYDEENRPRRKPEARPLEVAPLALEGAVVALLAMAGFYLRTGPRDAGTVWFQQGSADAARIAAGEGWRTLTALSLHADAAHLIANLVFGSFFLTLAGRIFGPGVALAAVVLAGALGNATNALLRSGEHVSVGASTAVFAAVGLLCGAGLVVRRRRGEGLRRGLLPVAGGLGILAMLGSGGGRVDVFAHLFGFVMGIPLGTLLLLALRRPPGPLLQLASAAAASASLVLAWRLALG